jgi:hypothetical protein
VIFEVRGGIAQLGERLHGMQEVSGSIPLTSTKIDGLYVGLIGNFILEKAVNSVKCSLFYATSSIGLNSKVPIV